MRNTINPTLCSTAEYQPCMVHAGPFANIAVGQSSIIGDRLGLKLFDYHVTESGFAADIGFEKFWNVKCRGSGLKPNVSVLTTTIRALKMHGGGPRVAPGVPLAREYTRKTWASRKWSPQPAPPPGNHSEVRDQSGGLHQLVHTEPEGGIALIRRAAEAPARAAPSPTTGQGRRGALELADAVLDACRDRVDFKFLYPLSMKLRDRVELIAREVYGADGVAWAPGGLAQARRWRPTRSTTTTPP